MYGWRNTSDPSALIKGLHRQPVLAVLRPRDIHEARHQLQLLQQSGLRHVELAVQAEEVWVGMARSLVIEFPGLRLGAASVCTPAGLQAAIAAGLGYVVSPILDPQLLQQAADASITLVPGVFSPSEVAAAVRWGASAVKLYPAASLGSAYWRSLAGPLHPCRSALQPVASRSLMCPVGSRPEWMRLRWAAPFSAEPVKHARCGQGCRICSLCCQAENQVLPLR